MNLEQILTVFTLIVGSLLVVSILLQQRGSGLGNIFGGGGGEVYRSKRGIEKFLFNSTIVLTVLFVALAISLAILNS